MENVDFELVDSSMIESVGYDFETNSLYVNMISNGRTYQYINVAYDEYERLKNAPSIGQYFIKHIKPNYSFNKL